MLLNKRHIKFYYSLYLVNTMTWTSLRCCSNKSNSDLWKLY